MNDKRRIILVTGSRKWTDRDAVLGALAAEHPGIIIHGACPSGADKFAAEYAAYRPDAFDIPMPAQWRRFGNRAGPLRNLEEVRMLVVLRSFGHDCTVMAFPKGESHGTRDCMRKAEHAEFRVVEPCGPSDPLSGKKYFGTPHI